ncbi:MAG: ATP-grasp domain-containing protein [Campylobacteraceae bacterium]|nr:ATP-grasp domain-containing protein [Campylobacteraceae bacterium]
MKKTILILNAGKEAVEGIKIAKSMGLNVIVCDYDKKAPGITFADDFIFANIYDPNEIIRALKDYPFKTKIDGVITIAADNPLSVAIVAKYLGINGQSENTAKIATNKLLMKQILSENNIKIPWFCEITSKQQLHDILKNNKNKNYVLKPIDSRGSRGVIRLNSIDNISNAFDYSIAYSKSQILILEEWLDGFQLSSESIVYKNISYLCGLADRNYDMLDLLYPYVVENGGETPSIFSKQISQEINNIITKIANAINLSEGSIKGDLILFNNEIYVIEFATRLSGGYFSTHTIPAVYDYKLIENIIKIALEQTPVLPKQPLLATNFQKNRFLFLDNGKIKSININANLSSQATMIDIFVKEGDIVCMPKNHTQRAGTIFAVASSQEEATQIVENALSSIKIVIE